MGQFTDFDLESYIKSYGHLGIFVTFRKFGPSRYFWAKCGLSKNKERKRKSIGLPRFARQRFLQSLGLRAVGPARLSR